MCSDWKGKQRFLIHSNQKLFDLGRGVYSLIHRSSKVLDKQLLVFCLKGAKETDMKFLLTPAISDGQLSDTNSKVTSGSTFQVSDYFIYLKLQCIIACPCARGSGMSTCKSMLQKSILWSFTEHFEVHSLTLSVSGSLPMHSWVMYLKSPFKKLSSMLMQQK